MNDPGVVPRIAFQGERGAFSEEAAGALLGAEIELLPCATFEHLFAAVADGRADGALVPVENTLAGSIRRTHELLAVSDAQIVAEVVIPITHALIGCPGATFDAVRVVESHPVALAQCEKFFAAQTQLAPLASDDTAASVRRVVERGDPARAAIAGARAASLYGGSLLRDHLEDQRENFTRFVLLARAPFFPEQANKLSVMIAPRPMALFDALKLLDERGLELLKIESYPIPGQPWRYRFFIDASASVSRRELRHLLADIGEQADEVRLLGFYPSTQTSINRIELLRSLKQ
ncbi:MAG: hypothetical protein LC747_05940 [Acidobacteria bacterium]|nr:hypothetical protein [Acidobacteriota bacterium]